MKRGRAPLPTALKILAGNPGKRKLPENEPKPDLVQLIAPDHLDAKTKEVWLVLANKLFGCGILSFVDDIALEMLTTTYVEWRELDEEVKKEGRKQVTQSGYQCPTAAWSMKKVKHKELLTLLGEFGMSPSSRSRINTVIGHQNLKDELDKFIN